MTTQTVIAMHPDELLAAIRRIVQEEIARSERYVTRSEIARMFSVTPRCVDGWRSRGLITPVTPDGTRPMFALSEVLNLNNKR